MPTFDINQYFQDIENERIASLPPQNDKHSEKLNKLGARLDEKRAKLGLTGNITGLNDADSIILERLGGTRSGTPSGNRYYDAIEIAHQDRLEFFDYNVGGLDKRRETFNTQNNYVAELLGKNPADVTKQDFIDVGNMQQVQKLSDLAKVEGDAEFTAPLIRGAIQTNLTGRDYQDEFGNITDIPLNIPVNYEVTGSAGGRDVVNLQNPQTLRNITEEAYYDPLQNITFDSGKPAVGAEQFGYIDADGRIGEDIDIAQASLVKEYAGAIDAISERVRDVFGIDDKGISIGGYDTGLFEKDLKLGLLDDHRPSEFRKDPKLADKLTGVKEETRAEQQALNTEIEEEYKAGNIFSTVWAAVKNADRMLADSAGIMATLTIPVAGVGIATNTRLADQKRTFEKNNAREMTGSEEVTAAAGIFATLYYEKLLVKAGLGLKTPFNKAPQSVKDAFNRIVPGGKVSKAATGILASTAGEAVQEAAETVQEELATQKVGARTISEIIKDDKIGIAAIQGAVAGGALRTAAEAGKAAISTLDGDGIVAKQAQKIKDIAKTKKDKEIAKVEKEAEEKVNIGISDNLEKVVLGVKIGDFHSANSFLLRAESMIERMPEGEQKEKYRVNLKNHRDALHIKLKESVENMDKMSDDKLDEELNVIGATATSHEEQINIVETAIESGKDDLAFRIADNFNISEQEVQELINESKEFSEIEKGATSAELEYTSLAKKYKRAVSAGDRATADKIRTSMDRAFAIENNNKAKIETSIKEIKGKIESAVKIAIDDYKKSGDTGKTNSEIRSETINALAKSKSFNKENSTESIEASVVIADMVKAKEDDTKGKFEALENIADNTAFIKKVNKSVGYNIKEIAEDFDIEKAREEYALEYAKSISKQKSMTKAKKDTAKKKMKALADQIADFESNQDTLSGSRVSFSRLDKDIRKTEARIKLAKKAAVGLLDKRNEYKKSIKGTPTDKQAKILEDKSKKVAKGYARVRVAEAELNLLKNKLDSVSTNVFEKAIDKLKDSKRILTKKEVETLSEYAIDAMENISESDSVTSQHKTLAGIIGEAGEFSERILAINFGDGTIEQKKEEIGKVIVDLNTAENIGKDIQIKEQVAKKRIARKEKTKADIAREAKVKQEIADLEAAFDEGVESFEAKLKANENISETEAEKIMSAEESELHDLLDAAVRSPIKKKGKIEAVVEEKTEEELAIIAEEKAERDALVEEYNKLERAIEFAEDNKGKEVGGKKITNETVKTLKAKLKELKKLISSNRIAKKLLKFSSSTDMEPQIPDKYGKAEGQVEQILDVNDIMDARENSKSLLATEEIVNISGSEVLVDMVESAKVLLLGGKDESGNTIEGYYKDRTGNAGNIKKDFEMINSPSNALLFSIDKEGPVKTEQINDNVIAAIVLAGEEYVSTMLTSTMWNSDEDIASMLGVQEFQISNKQKTALRTAGKFKKFVSRDLGNTVFRQLGLQFKDDVNLDVADKMRADMGQRVLIYLEATEKIESLISPKSALDMGLLKGKGIDLTLIASKDEIGGKKVGMVVPSAKFKRGVKNPKNTDLEDSQKVFEEISESVSMEMTSSSYQFHKIGEVDEWKVSRSDAQAIVPEESADILTSMQKEEWEFDTVAFDEMLEAGDKVILESMGFTPQSELDGMTLYTRESKEAKNEELVENLNELKKLREHYTLKEKRKESTGMYFKWFFSKNGRFMLDSITVNPQTDKLARFIVGMKSQNVDMDMSKREHEVAFKFAVAQGLGIDIDKESTASIMKKADEFIAMGVDKVKKGLTDGTIKTDHISHGFKAVQGIKAFNASKDGKFKTSLTLELDGVTNGFSIKLMQSPLISKNVSYLEKTGVFVDSEGNGTDVNRDDVSFNDELNRTENPILDSYKTLAKTMGDTDSLLEGSGLSTDEISTFKTLMDKDYFPDIVDEKGNVTKGARELFKYPFMTFNYGSSIKNIVESLKLSLTEEVANKILSDLEKNPVATIKILQETFGVKGITKRLLISQLKENDLSTIVIGNPKLGKTVNLSDVVSKLVEKTYGAKVEMALEAEFGEFVEANKTINDSFKVMFRLWYEAYDRARVKAGTDWTDQKKIETILALQDRFPMISAPFSQSDADRVAVSSSKSMAVDNKTKAAQTTVNEKRYGQKTITIQSTLRDFEEAMAAGGVIPIHYLDGSIISKVLSRGGVLGIHDAIMPRLDNAIANVKVYNEHMYKINKEYNVIDEVRRSLEYSIEYAEKFHPADVKAVNRRARKDETDRNKNRRKKLSQEEMDALALTTGNVSTDMVELSDRNNEARAELYKNHMLIHQMAFAAESGYKTTDADVKSPISQYEARVIPDEAISGSHVAETVKAFEELFTENEADIIGELENSQVKKIEIYLNNDITTKDSLTKMLDLITGISRKKAIEIKKAVLAAFDRLGEPEVELEPTKSIKKKETKIEIEEVVEEAVSPEGFAEELNGTIPVESETIQEDMIKEAKEIKKDCKNG